MRRRTSWATAKPQRSWPMPAWAATARAATANAPLLSVRFAVGGEIDGFESYDAALSAERDDLIDDPTPGSQMLYTSGTTGDRRACTDRRPPRRPCSQHRRLRRGGGDVHLCTGPLYHAAPLDILAVGAAAHSAQASCSWTSGMPRRRCGSIERASASPTRTWCPTMFHRLLSLPDDVRTDVRHVVVALRVARRRSVPGAR